LGVNGRLNGWCGINGCKWVQYWFMLKTDTIQITDDGTGELVEPGAQTARLHPLLIIALFVVVFLEIHPFQDGNGRLSRVLTTLLLLQAGYRLRSLQFAGKRGGAEQGSLLLGLAADSEDDPDGVTRRAGLSERPSRPT
jgi:hypothetical protein